MSAYPHVDDFLSRITQVKPCGPNNWKAVCPAHDDSKPSLSIRICEKERILMKCFAGCQEEAILARLNMPKTALFPSTSDTYVGSIHKPRPFSRPAGTSGKVVKAYDYTDEHGALLYQSVRYEPKRFSQRRPDGNNGWIDNLNDVRRVLYCLPDIVKEVAKGESILFPEGEKDVDRLRQYGYAATTTAMGAGANWQPEYSEFLHRARVVILPDNDDAGRQCCDKRAAALQGIAADVRILELPGLPEKGDVSDWFDAGGTPIELDRLIENAPQWIAPVNSPNTTQTDANPSPARPLCLADVKAEAVEWLWKGWIPFGKISMLVGDPGLGKSNLSLDIAARLTTGKSMPFNEISPYAPADVLLLLVEDGLADTVRPRMEAAGADLKRVHAYNPEDALDMLSDLPRLEMHIREYNVRMVVVDPLMAFFPAALDAHKDQHTRRLLSPVSALAQRTGAAFVFVHHQNKSGGTRAVYRAGGSIGITGAARASALVAQDPENPAGRIMASIKSNLGREPQALRFHLESALDIESDPDKAPPRVVWDGVADNQTANTLLASPMPAEEDRSEREEATNFLRALLNNGPLKTAEIEREAKSAGISLSTLKRARSKAGIQSRRVGGIAGSGYWELYLPSIEGVTS